MEKLEEQAKSIAEDARKDKPSAAAGQKGVLFVRYVMFRLCKFNPKTTKSFRLNISAVFMIFTGA